MFKGFVLGIVVVIVATAACACIVLVTGTVPAAAKRQAVAVGAMGGKDFTACNPSEERADGPARYAIRRTGWTARTTASG
jgi:hypothetical protein